MEDPPCSGTSLPVLTAALLLFGALGPAAAEKRVALVIGNSAYQHAAGRKLGRKTDASIAQVTLE
jgi:hypothetical protein